MDEFSKNETGYIYWVADNPDGYVLNLRQSPDPSYVVLHRAKCGLICSTKHEPGAYTERSYRKICSASLDELREAARREGRDDRSFSKVCSVCIPEGLPKPVRRPTQTATATVTGTPAGKTAKPTFEVKLGKAYWSQGFFNVGVSHERYFGRHDAPIEIFLGAGSSFVTGHINRTANQNQTPRIMGGSLVKAWIQRNSKPGRSIRVEVIAPDRIRVTA